MLEEAAPSLSCLHWGDKGVSREVSAGRGNSESLNKGPRQEAQGLYKDQCPNETQRRPQGTVELPLLGW